MHLCHCLKWTVSTVGSKKTNRRDVSMATRLINERIHPASQLVLGTQDDEQN